MTPLVVDFDDLHDGNQKMDRIHELKRINPLFRCTMFAIPGLCSDAFLEGLPRWIELAVHGWEHPTPLECERWSKERMLKVMDAEIVRKHFVNGFKAPGWQISDGCYRALFERGWWIADQHYNKERRSILRVDTGIRIHTLDDGNHAHHHIQDWGSNGIDESWDTLSRRVAEATEFRFVSEMAR